ncbi:MAG: hypothetical protein IBX59_07995 [Yoonia sp.]|nr:hypothetical protein [Yoonia sp.]
MRGFRGQLRAVGIRRAVTVLTRAFGLDMHVVIDAYFAQMEEQNIAFQHIHDGIARMAAKDLSHRTETQVAALEQTAAAVDEINGNMRASNNATAETDQVVAQTHENAQRGNAAMQESVTMMREIAKSLAQISQIITLIDDIAFQTNLLALNAGVEAARAGEAGRGFAVVASEVRGLARRASESAMKIGTLIQNSGRLVESGVQLADQAGDSLSNIVSEVNRASVLMAQVTSALQEQATGLAEIAAGVAQLDSMTQHNGAMAGQTAAAIAAMQHDTRLLAQLVDAFILVDKAKVWQAPAAA